MKHKRRFIYLGGILILVFGLGFSTLGNKDLELVKNLDIYYTLFRELNMFYVDETDPEELVTTSIEAMLSSLDPYTTFIPHPYTTHIPPLYRRHPFTSQYHPYTYYITLYQPYTGVV